MKELSKTWKKRDGNLYKKYTFSNYKDGISFVNTIPYLIEDVLGANVGEIFVM